MYSNKVQIHVTASPCYSSTNCTEVIVDQTLIRPTQCSGSKRHILHRNLYHQLSRLSILPTPTAIPQPASILLHRTKSLMGVFWNASLTMTSRYSKRCTTNTKPELLAVARIPTENITSSFWKSNRIRTILLISYSTKKLWSKHYCLLITVILNSGIIRCSQWRNMVNTSWLHSS